MSRARNLMGLVREHLWPAARVYWGLVRTCLRADSRRSAIKRFGAMCLFLPLVVVVQAWHWLGFVLDEVLFPRYRETVVSAPVFIIGVPRSGTTLLHRTLAEDHEQFTTLRTWELLFGLSITARQLWLALARVDRACGHPVGRLVRCAERSVFRRLDGIHDVSLRAPEEDYLTLTPIGACFLLVIAFPSNEALWRLARFDQGASPSEQRRIMAFYRLCLQKHLYIYGERRLLSKNPAFSSLVNALRETFPDCRVICCLRDPVASVSSLLGSVEPGLAAFAVDRAVARARLIDMMHHYYQHLITQLPELPRDRHAYVTLDELRADLAETVRRLYGRLGLPMSAAFRARLAAASLAARTYRSANAASLTRFGLDEQRLRREFDTTVRRAIEDSLPRRPVEHER